MLWTNLSRGCDYYGSSAVPCPMKRVTGVSGAADGMERYRMTYGRTGLRKQFAQPVFAGKRTLCQVQSVTHLRRRVRGIPAFRDGQSSRSVDKHHPEAWSVAHVTCIGACDCTCISMKQIREHALSGSLFAVEERVADVRPLVNEFQRPSTGIRAR